MGEISHMKGSLVWMYNGKQYRSYNTAYKAFRKVSPKNPINPTKPLNSRESIIEKSIENSIESKLNPRENPVAETYKDYAIGIGLLILSIFLFIYFIVPYIRRYWNSSLKT